MSSADAWASPWLAWLEEVENRSGIRNFGKGEDGAAALEFLRDLFDGDAAPEQGAAWLEAYMDKWGDLSDERATV